VHRTLTRADFHVTDYSPWEGWTVTGWPVTTLLRGKVIVDRGALLGTTSDGRELTRAIDPVILRRPAC
jgi:dihydropyrimidinase